MIFINYDCVAFSLPGPVETFQPELLQTLQTGHSLVRGAGTHSLQVKYKLDIIPKFYHHKRYLFFSFLIVST